MVLLGTEVADLSASGGFGGWSGERYNISSI